MCDRCGKQFDCYGYAQGEAGEAVKVEPPLAKKHKGMKVSASGILLRVRGELRFGAEEMNKHLNEMADRYYSGDIAAVDEFCQLYCLDRKRPVT